MSIYHKISGPFLRASDGTLTNEWSDETFKLLADNLWQFTEKLDGTNIRVMWDGYRVSFGGRTDNATLPEPLLEYLNKHFGGSVNEQKFEQKFGEKPVVFYGEGVGEKIQKHGERYGSQHLVLFDVKIGNVFLKREDLVEIAGFFNTPVVPMLPLMTLNEAVKLVGDGLTSAYGDWIVEGLVGTPLGGLLNRQCRRIVVKVKTEDFMRSNS